MTEKEFAALMPQIFSKPIVRAIKEQTYGGSSALQIVRRALKIGLAAQLTERFEYRKRSWGEDYYERFPEDAKLLRDIMR